VDSSTEESSGEDDEDDGIHPGMKRRRKKKVKKKHVPQLPAWTRGESLDRKRSATKSQEPKKFKGKDKADSGWVISLRVILRHSVLTDVLDLPRLRKMCLRGAGVSSSHHHPSWVRRNGSKCGRSPSEPFWYGVGVRARLKRTGHISLEPTPLQK
jgi:hypothetical protein